MSTVAQLPGLDDGSSVDQIDTFDQIIDEKTTTVEGFVKILAERYFADKSLEGIQEFQAQIYSVERILLEEQDNRLYSNENKYSSEKTYYKCTARISIINDTNPIPSSFGDTEDDKKIIELYETIPVISYIPVSVGEIVTVKFDNLKAKTGCKVVSRENPKPSGQGSIRPAGATPPKNEIKKGFSNKGNSPTTIGSTTGV